MVIYALIWVGIEALLSKTKVLVNSYQTVVTWLDVGAVAFTVCAATGLGYAYFVN